MVRYAQRPWYTPLGMMAHAPLGWPCFALAFFGLVTWPFRYRISRYLELQQVNPQADLKNKAIMYYLQLDRFHKRVGHFNSSSSNGQEDHMEVKAAAHQISASTMIGNTDAEQMYWHAYRRDMLRAERLVEELRELKAKVGDGAVGTA